MTWPAFIYLEDCSNCSPQQLNGFFQGWPNPPSPQTHLMLLQNSDHCILALEQNSGKVVGFITAITDHTLFAYISLVEVLPEFQNQGIGKALVEKMLEKLKGLYSIDLLCDEDVQPFYRKFNFKASIHSGCFEHL